MTPPPQSRMVTPVSAEAIAIVGVGVAVLRRDLHALAERVARIEGALTGALASPQRLACSGAQGRPSGGYRRVTGSRGLSAVRQVDDQRE